MRLLQHLREEYGWNRVELGRRASLNPNRVGQIEAGRAVPPDDSVELVRLARALGFPGEQAHRLLEEVGDGPRA